MSKEGGLLNFRCSLKRGEFTKPWVRTNFVAFPQERALKFGSILGRDRGLINNCPAAAGRAPNWTGRTLKSSDLSYTLTLIRDRKGTPKNF